MFEFIVTFLAFSLSIFLMAIGYVLAKKKLTGSCGGLGKITGACFICKLKPKTLSDEVNDSGVES